MEQSKLTAVEFLENKIVGNDVFSFSELFKHAKELEKQQIIDAYSAGEIRPYNAEQYYNETFKKDA